MAYDLAEHHHRLDASTASSAASVKGCRFSVQQGKAIIDAIGLKTAIEPTGAEQTDAQHRVWREAAIKAAEAQGLQFTHGVAAKLINVYLKARRLGGPDQHPPINSVLLTQLSALSAENFKDFRDVWDRARRRRWSKFTSDDYEEVIRALRKAMRDEPLWKVEEHWSGFQNSARRPARSKVVQVGG